MNQSKISVVIPAYNNPSYTKKTIYSIFDQTHRPIEIILSDDNSPNSLEDLAALAYADCPEGIEIKYFRQDENLDHYWNMEFCLKNATGNFLILLDHDDWLTDNLFFSDAIRSINSNEECYVSVFNVILEGSNTPIFGHRDEKVLYVDGGHFIKEIFKDLSVGPNKCGVVYDFDKLKELNYLDYFIEKKIGAKLNVKPEDAYLPICLLASCGNVAFSGKVVSVRGRPDSALSLSRAWQSDVGVKHFLPFFLLYSYFDAKNFEDGRSTMKKNMLSLIPCEYINYEILEHLHLDTNAISFMVQSSLPKNPSEIYFKYLIEDIYRNLTDRGYKGTIADLLDLVTCHN